ncbi:MAG: HIT family protein [Candidatus Paracaedibacteraceae bacterium]|nr:HIT family protein [Candidatus Paracaedibacteraceae bacterium]
MFCVDDRLLKNTMFAYDLPLCRVLIQDDVRFPWFILVPKVNNVTELFELTKNDQNKIILEITHISHYLKEELQIHKVNVGALGNIVPQLHIHVIGRMQNDAAWPGPVWGVGTAIHHTKGEIQLKVQRLNDWLKKNSLVS